MTDAAAARPWQPALVCLLDEESDPLGLSLRLDLPGAPLDPASWDHAVFGPARDFLSRPGKWIRGRLVELGWEIAGGARHGCPRDLAACIELVHAGSLIVDDVEDEAIARRGAPALHHTWGAPLAINTGCWMYFAALDRLARLELPPNVTARLQRDAVRTLLRCHHGQALDLALDVLSLRQPEVRRSVEATTVLKTGCLVGLAASMGAIAARAPNELVDALASFGTKLGTALQMLDDLGSIVAPERLEKGIEDVRGKRPTWPWAWAASSLDEVGYARLVRSARRARSQAESPIVVIESLRRALTDDARHEPNRLLASAFAHLEDVASPSAALDELRERAAAMEAAYV